MSKSILWLNATANAPITPEAMVDDGKNIETIQPKSLPTGSREAQSSKAVKKEDWYAMMNPMLFVLILLFFTLRP